MSQVWQKVPGKYNTAGMASCVRGFESYNGRSVDKCSEMIWGEPEK